MLVYTRMVACIASLHIYIGAYKYILGLCPRPRSRCDSTQIRTKLLPK